MVSGSRTESSAREVLGVIDSGTVTTHSFRLNRGATSFSSPNATTTVPVPAGGKERREEKQGGREGRNWEKEAEREREER